MYVEYDTGLLRYLEGTGVVAAPLQLAGVTLDTGLSLPSRVFEGDIDGDGIGAGLLVEFACVGLCGFVWAC